MVTPRQAATVILVRGGSDRLEALLVQRHPDQRFLGGYWVFPGGAVDSGDEGAHRAAAVRELEEEAGVSGLELDDMVHFSRWITPASVKIRFDTHFFIAQAPEGVEPRVDGEEVVAMQWLSPEAALAAHDAGELPAIFPTIKHLEQLAEFATADELIAHARSRHVAPVEPRIVNRDGTDRLLLPGEPGYDEAAVAG